MRSERVSGFFASWARVVEAVMMRADSANRRHAIRGDVGVCMVVGYENPGRMAGSPDSIPDRVRVKMRGSPKK